MSTLEAVSETVRALSPEQQQKVLEYAQLLQQETCHPKSSLKQETWRSHPFVGMWKDRAQRQDSVEWVREVRKSEWRES